MSLKSIAVSLGLSVTTVSRALAGYSDVSEVTRERVRREADRIGYVPNEVARRLQKGRSDAFGLVLPGGPTVLDDPCGLDLITGVWSRLAEFNLDLVVLPSLQGAQEERIYRRLAEGRRVDGLILTRVREADPRVDYLRSIQFPFVTLDAAVSGFGGVPYVHFDPVAAMRLLIERLVGLGHRDIILLGNDDGFRFVQARTSAFETECARLGLHPKIRTGALSEAGGRQVIADLIGAGETPTAVIGVNDRMAIGAMWALADHGLQVGSDVSVVAFGDSRLADYVLPALTIVRAPLNDMAHAAVDILVSLRDGLSASGRDDWPIELIVRGSDGPPRH